MTAVVEVPLATLGKEISARIAAGDKAVAKGEDHYRAAGLQLIQAKARVRAEGGSFIAFYQQFGMKKETVGKCIAIADGRKTLSGIRADDAERQAKKSERDRDLISVSHGNAAPAAITDVDSERETLRAENARLVAERDQALDEVERLKAEVARLTREKTAAQREAAAPFYQAASAPAPSSLHVDPLRGKLVKAAPALRAAIVTEPSNNDTADILPHIRDSWKKHAA